MSLQSYITQAHADIARLAPAAYAAADAAARAKGIALIGEPCPAGARLYGLARQLARPVAHGYTSEAHAVASLLVATTRAHDHNELGPYKAPDIFRGMRDAFATTLAREIEAREVTIGRIKRVLAPLIGQHKPRNVLLAEAHGVNGRDGFPLTEAEVEEVAATEVWWSIQRSRRRVRG